MIGHSRALAVFAYTEPCDMRKSFHTLGAVVEHELGRDPLCGDMFLFVSRDRRRAKVLYFDGTGLCLLAKKLSRGKFSALWNRKVKQGMELSPAELALFIEGSDSVGRIPMSPPLLAKRELSSRKLPSPSENS